MTKIPLTRGAYAVIDDDDADRVVMLSWQLDNAGYAVGKTRDNKSIKMHRVIIGAPPGVKVDHIDRNKLNNMKSNLRLCTDKQNVWNVGPRLTKGRTSKYKGVHKEIQTGRWRAMITVHGKQIPLGRFDSDVEAALRYNEAALKYFGEFAYLNPVQSDRKLAETAEHEAIITEVGEGSGL